MEVFYILAKGYLSHELGMLGFPAYDRSQMLLGFYKEVQSQAGQTQVRIDVGRFQDFLVGVAWHIVGGFSRLTGTHYREKRDGEESRIHEGGTG